MQPFIKVFQKTKSLAEKFSFLGREGSTDRTARVNYFKVLCSVVILRAVFIRRTKSSRIKYSGFSAAEVSDPYLNLTDYR